MIEPRGYKLLAATQEIAVATLNTIEEKHGKNSAQPLTYHNAEHGIDLGRRAILLTNLLHDEIPGNYREYIYDLDVLVGTGHDSEQSAGTLNERMSAIGLVKFIEANGDPILNTNEIKRRAYGGVDVTLAYAEDDGNVIQPLLMKGERDPLKFIACFADVDAIAMEGIQNMLITSSKLPKELFSNPEPKVFYGFLAKEEPFLRKRLNDWRMNPAIRYYFPQSADTVYEKMHEAFNKNIVAAYEFAKAAAGRPDLSDAIGEALRSEEYEKVGELIEKPIQPTD